MRFEIGRHAGDRVRKVAGADVLERPSFAPSEMLVPRHWSSPCWLAVTPIAGGGAQIGGGGSFSGPEKPSPPWRRPRVGLDLLIVGSSEGLSGGVSSIVGGRVINIINMIYIVPPQAKDSW